MRLDLKVVPKASRDRIVGWVGDRLKIAVTAPPERGKANEAVVELLADTLELPASLVRIVSGLAHSLKTVEIVATDDSRIFSKLPARD
jgi:uncharacterized protein (TIGR00251 family)